MSELPAGVTRARPPEPRDSSSCVVLRRTADAWEVLLGIRSRRSRFMPGQLAFPGGAVDPVDGGEDARYAHCATRELREETGVEVPVERWLEAGERTTPPIFPVRFRTRFFVATLPEESPAPRPLTEEIEELAFTSAARVLAGWTAGRVQVPPPVLPLLRELASADGAETAEIAERLRAANALERRAPRIEFLPDVWMLPVGTATLPPATHTNVWIPGGRRFVVIDPGSPDADEQRRLLEVIDRRRALGQTAQAVLLTHHHHDHTGGAVELARGLELPLLAHPHVLERLGADTAGVTLEPMDDGDELGLDGMSLRALHTPGHAKGHLAFQLPESRTLIAGDLVSGISTILIDPERGDMGAYLASLELARSLDCELLLPGHGPPLPGRALGRLIEHRRDRERKILGALADGASGLDEIARRAYAEEPGLPLPLIERQTLAHLNDLRRRGMARCDDGAARLWSPGEGT